MSLIILEFAKSFVAGRLSAEIFAEAYIELWKIERDNNFLQRDAASLSECLSSVFCASDMYGSGDSRGEYELDDESLRLEVVSLIGKLISD